MRLQLLLLAAALTGAPLAAQQSVLFSFDADEFFLDMGGGLAAAGELLQDEVAIVTPIPGAPYSASNFLSREVQSVWLGDADIDGRYVDSSSDGPGQDTDAIMIRRTGPPSADPVAPRDVFLSKEGIADFALGFEDSDVFRYTVGTLGIEVFLTETMLVGAIGGTASLSFDLDAICQNDAGDLFLSFAGTETVNGTSVLDGGIVHIPAASITYDAFGNVTAIAPASAVEVATEADVNAWIAASGMQTSVGGAPTTSIDTTALEIDPAGGTWTSAQTAGTYPNLLFAWNGYSNDGAVITTAGGGTIATVNGVSLGSTVATWGTEIGMLPDSTGLNGLMGLAVIDYVPDPFTVENWPSTLITSSTILWNRQEVSGCLPGTTVLHFYDFGPKGAGGVVPVTPLPGIGDLYGLGMITTIGFSVADVNGHASITSSWPLGAVGSGINLVTQAAELGPFIRLAEPGAVQFL